MYKLYFTAVNKTERNMQAKLDLLSFVCYYHYMMNIESNKIVRLNIEITLKERYKLKEIAARRNVSLRVIISALLAAYIKQEEKYQ